ncbi:MAG: hypothetical protein CUN55_04910 [Phototrophicales bacterium]|nr:MAG: hypothetical protein CUN55_04910 [Phototrophicales bacterium]
MNIPTDRHISEITFYVRYAETDQMGIVHHSSYLLYAEELRMQYMRDIGLDYAKFEAMGCAFAVTCLEYRYLTPAVFGQRITVKGWVTEFKSRRVSFAYVMYNPDTNQKHVTACSDQILVDRQGQVRRIPEFMIRAHVENSKPKAHN